MTKRKRKDPLAGKRDPISQLYRAVRRYVEHNGGRLLVVGGVQIEQSVADLKHNWRLAVRCTGVQPTLKRRAEGKSGD